MFDHTAQEAPVPKTTLPALPTNLYVIKQVRILDNFVIEDLGISGFKLMQCAAKAAFTLLLEENPRLLKGEHLQVFCGAGKNAGDGYVLAALAKKRGISVQVVVLKSPHELTGEAQLAYQMARDQEVSMCRFQDDFTIRADVIVDALLGTGLQGEVTGAYVTAIDLINKSRVRVFALDVPSGLDADKGVVLGHAVVADWTATFIAMKCGLLTGVGPRCCGRLFFCDLSLPKAILEHLTADVLRLDKKRVFQPLQPRPKDAHKGQNGHLLVVGGDHQFGGAAIIAAQGALYTGVGLVSLATRHEHIAAALAQRPEIMVKAVEDRAALAPELKGKDMVVFGPGAGVNEWSQALLEEVWHAPVALLVDADGLNLLACFQRPRREAPLIITPHPGEAARLLNTQVATVQGDRFAAVRALERQYRATVVLKGPGTLISAFEHPIYLCSQGNPSLAVGGMGDLLSGVIGSLVAQGLTAVDAACLGVWLHAVAADNWAARQGERGLLATDLLEPLRAEINGYE